MPLTQEQIANFTAKARAAGASDEQIIQSIAKKRAEVDAVDRATEAYKGNVIDKETAYKSGVPLAALTAQAANGDIISQIKGLPTVGERNKAVASKDILDVINNAIQKSKSPDGANTPTGPISAILSGIKNTFGTVDKTSQLNKDLSEILRTIRKESTGVAFSPQEITDLEKEIPTVWQQEANVQDSLSRLKGRILSKLTNQGLDVSKEFSGSTNLDSFDEDLINKYKKK